VAYARRTARRGASSRSRTASSRRAAPARRTYARRAAPRRASSRARARPQEIRLVIETTPANPVSRLGQTPQAPAPQKAKF
jgi:hypothetical protein